MKIIPKPQKFVPLSGEFVLKNNSTVYADKELTECLKYFVDYVKQNAGIDLIVQDKVEGASISFAVLKAQDPAVQNYYEINMANGIMNVIASNAKYCFYAMQTVFQLLDKKEDYLTGSNCHIKDSPKYHWRGLMLDVARHFVALEDVKNILRLMARVKLNKLHLHLSDDQGFRVQIDKYPQINKISSYRNGTEYRLNGRQFVDDNVHGGYYTKAEIRELVDYALKLNIDIIPEIDIPGHCVALLASFPENSCSGNVKEVRKTWGISKDLLCVGNDSTLQIIKDIIDEVADLFPFEYFHLGGDETPKDRWCNCKLCNAKLSELKLSDYEQLQSWFVNEVAKHLAQKGKRVICWNDGVNELTDINIVSQHWKPKTMKSTIQQLNHGRDTIMSPFFHMYFDYPYAMTSVKKTYNYNPAKGVTDSGSEHLLGVEGTLWTEFVGTMDKLYFQLIPRLYALAECAWGTNNNYHNFVKRAKRECKFVIDKGISCNINFRPKNIFSRYKIVRKFFNNDTEREYNKYLLDNIKSED